MKKPLKSILRKKNIVLNSKDSQKDNVDFFLLTFQNINLTFCKLS